MKKRLAAIACLAVSTQVFAAGQVLNDLKVDKELSAEDLNQLMPGAGVVYHPGNGSTQRWTNEPGGKFTASTDGRGGMSGKGATAQGTWHVAPNGTYCVTLEWRSKPVNWCRHILKVGDKYYGVKALGDGTTPAFEFEFSK